MSVIADSSDASDTDSSRRSREGILATARGGGFLAGGHFFEYIGRFVMALLLARILGAGDYGLYVLAIGTAALLAGISQLGLDDAMVRYVAILSGRGDREGLWGAVQIGLGISVAVGLITGGGLFLASGWVAVGVFENASFAPVLRLVGLMVPVLTVSNVLAGTARGFGRMDYAAAAENIVMSLVRLGLVVLLVLAGNVDVYAAVIVFGISDVAASMTLMLLLNKDFPLRGVLGRRARRDIAPILRFALPLWLSGVLRQFRKNIETFMLGALAAVSSVGVFAVAAKANLVAHVFLLSLLLAVKPTLARLHDRGRREELGHVYRATTRWALTLNLPFSLLMILFPESLLSVFGSSFVQGSQVLVILAVAELVNSATGICGPMIDMTGHTRVKLANSVLWTLLTITSSAILIPLWGAVGAAAGFLVGVVVVNILSIIEVWILEGLNPYDRTFVKPILAGAGALACGLALRTWAPAGISFGHAALYGVLIGIVYVALLLSFRLPPDDRLVLKRLFGKLTSLLAHRGVARRAAQEAGPA